MSDSQISFTSMDEFLLYKRYMEEKNRVEVEEINDNVTIQEIYTNVTTSTTQQEYPEPNITQSYDQTYHYTNEDEMLELLIMEVQAHEALWDRSSKLYHNSQQTRAAWVAIATNLNQEVETLKKNGETCTIVFVNVKMEKTN